MTRFSHVLALALIAAASGCGKDISAPVAATLITPPQKKPADPSAPSLSVEVYPVSSPTRYTGEPVYLSAHVGLAGKPVVGDTVTWTVVSGGGNFTFPKQVTDELGNATQYWWLGPLVGVQQAKASITYTSADKTVGVATVESAFSVPAAAPPPPPPLQPSPIALHFDGTTWSVSAEDTTHGCCGAVMRSVWGTSSSNVFAGGGNCPVGPFVMQYDGTAWQGIPTGCSGGLDGVISISGTSPSDVFAIAHTAYPPNSSSGIKHFDGHTWTDLYGEGCSLFTATCVQPTALWARAPNDVLTVGVGGEILHYDGAAWTAQQSGTSTNLLAVWGDRASGTAFAVGQAGTILSYDGSAWHPQASGTTQNLSSVWGTSPTDVFAVGTAGTILHFDGTAWTPQRSGTSVNLKGVWGNAPNSFFAVGDAGTVAHYDGSGWTVKTVDGLSVVNAVWGTSGSDVFAVGVSKY